MAKGEEGKGAERRVREARSAEVLSPRSSRSAYVTNSEVTFLRQDMSKSVLSSGLAILKASEAACAIASLSSLRPTRNVAASVATRGRDAVDPITMRASSIMPELEKRAAAATERTGKSKDPRRRSFQY